MSDRLVLAVIGGLSAVIVAAALGFLAFLAVLVAERLTLRNQRPAETAST